MGLQVLLTAISSTFLFQKIKRTAFGYSNFSNFKKHILIQTGIISISTYFFNSIK
ncbi:hypothetical protein [Fusobacterium polymorphum]|uniref:hypothetical protein n=1 Tax=Fusobacterium nucleatum subsp. polymorphum TaxID=76857 RepID=UPI00164D5BA4|nr:hypothetical protein [Fusobacterium polymorphum]